MGITGRMKKIFTRKTCWVAGTLFVGGLLGLSFFVGEFSKPPEVSSEVVRRNVSRKSVLANGINLMSSIQEQPMELSIGAVQLEKERLGPFLVGAFNALVLYDVSIHVFADSTNEVDAKDSGRGNPAERSQSDDSAARQEMLQGLEAILNEQLLPLLPKGVQFSAVKITSFDLRYVLDGREIPVFHAKTAKLDMKKRSLIFCDAVFKDEHLMERQVDQCTLALQGNEICVESHVGVTSLKQVAKGSLN